MPATTAVPEVGAIRVPRVRTVVVLPAPLGPRKPKTSPGGDREGDVLEGGALTEPLGQVRDPQGDRVSRLVIPRARIAIYRRHVAMISYGSSGASFWRCAMASPPPPIRITLVEGGDDLRERPAWTLSGWAALPIGLVCFVTGLTLVGRSLYLTFEASGPPRLLLGGGIALLVISAAAFRGVISISPGEAVVLRLGGSYLGTARRAGLWWANPGTRKTRISTRIRNHETGMLKVNDAEGNPIEIAAAVVWRVGDTARALLAVDDYAAFVRVQAEGAVRHVAGGYPYDTRGRDEPSMRGNPAEINHELSSEVASRVAAAGVMILDARLTRLAYAPEIAQAMLRVQQANAIVAARHRIVEGAVGMVELALDRLSEDAVVELDEERKATMVGNLLVVLCSDRDPQPVVNSGTLY